MGHQTIECLVHCRRARSNKQGNSSTSVAAATASQYDSSGKKALEGFARETSRRFKVSKAASYHDYIFDFVCLERKIVIEIDGGQHQDQRIEDHARTAVLTGAGFTVLRFWNHDVLQKTEAVLEQVWQEAVRKKNPSSPQPSP